MFACVWTTLQTARDIDKRNICAQTNILCQCMPMPCQSGIRRWITENCGGLLLHQPRPKSPSHLCSTLPRTSSFVFDNPRWQPHNAPPEIQSGFESLNSLSRIKNVSSGPSKCVKQHKTAVSCSKGSIWGGVGVGSARIGFMFWSP